MTTQPTAQTPSNLQGKDALVAFFQPRSAQAEAFRQLRTAIQHPADDQPLHTILATSPDPEDGKSAALANLAITLAQGGSRVTLVDCDLRRPIQHLLFGLQNTSGVANALAGNGDPLAQESGIPGLRVVTSGTLPTNPAPAPADLLVSERFEALMESLRRESDYVLVDTPPIVPVTDAAVLASRVDGVLLVLRAGKTKREMAQRAKELLVQVNARILGVVLTNAKPDKALGSYYAV